MSSVRERIVRALLDCVQTAVAPVPVLRQPTTAQPREAAPFVAVAVESDLVVDTINQVAQRRLVLRLTAVSRHAADPWGEADALLCQVHAALLADPSLGGLALGITADDTDFDAEDADAAAVALPAVYHIPYRTQRADLAQGG